MATNAHEGTINMYEIGHFFMRNFKIHGLRSGYFAYMYTFLFWHGVKDRGEWERRHDGYKGSPALLITPGQGPDL